MTFDHQQGELRVSQAADEVNIGTDDFGIRTAFDGSKTFAAEHIVLIDNERSYGSNDSKIRSTCEEKIRQIQRRRNVTQTISIARPDDMHNMLKEYAYVNGIQMNVIGK